jgi:hypothetical protein
MLVALANEAPATTMPSATAPATMPRDRRIILFFSLNSEEFLHYYQGTY